MPKSCAVLGCGNHGYMNYNTSANTKTIGFHHFPQDPVVRSYWTKAIGRENWAPTKNSVVCSDHFHKNDYFKKRKQGTKNHLNRAAIPNHTKRLEALPKSAPKYKCVKCRIVFGSIKEIESHISEAHSNASPSATIAALTTLSTTYLIPNNTEKLDALPKSAPKYICSKCKNFSGSIKEIEAHISEAHSNPPSSPSITALTTSTTTLSTTYLIPNNTKKLDALPKSAPKYKCIKCKNFSGSIKEIEAHKSEAHSNTPSPATIIPLTSTSTTTLSTTTLSTTSSSVTSAQDDADIKLAADIKHHLGLTSDQTFDRLGTERRMAVGNRLERILHNVTNVSLDSSLGSIKSVSEVNKTFDYNLDRAGSDTESASETESEYPLKGSKSSVNQGVADGEINAKRLAAMNGSAGQGIYNKDGKLVQKLPFHKVFV